MSLLSTLALVVIPLVKPRDRIVELEERLTAVEAERDLWRTECLVVREKLTNATLENIHLERQFGEAQASAAYWGNLYRERQLMSLEQAAHAAQDMRRAQWRYMWSGQADWADCTCTPTRADGLKSGGGE